MRRGVGRPPAALVPGDAERSFPGRRARRRRVAVPCPTVAAWSCAAPGACRTSWRRRNRRRPADGRQTAPPLREGSPRRAVGPAPVGTAADHRGRPGGARPRADASRDPTRCHPLVDPPDDRGGRPFAHRPPKLQKSRTKQDRDKEISNVMGQLGRVLERRFRVVHPVSDVCKHD